MSSLIAVPETTGALATDLTQICVIASAANGPAGPDIVQDLAVDANGAITYRIKLEASFKVSPAKPHHVSCGRSGALAARPYGTLGQTELRCSSVDAVLTSRTSSLRQLTMMPSLAGQAPAFHHPISYAKAGTECPVLHELECHSACVDEE